MAWKAKLESVDPLSTERDHIEMTITYYDDSVTPPTRTITKRETWNADTTTWQNQLLQLKGRCDTKIACLTKQDEIYTQLLARVGTVVSS